MSFTRFKSVMTAPTVGPACVIMGVAMLAFGLPFLSPWYPDFFQTQPYRNMNTIGRPFFWGVLLTTGGAWRLCSACAFSYSHRKVSSVAAIFLWSLLFFLRLLADPANPGVTVFGAFTLIDLWTFFRLNRMVDGAVQ